MLIGTMNHPAHDLFKEIQWMAAMGLEFVDLTLEPPAAAVWKIKPMEVRRALEDAGLPAVGHTAFYLPICSPFESIRRAAVEELKRCIDAFGIIGAKWMNIHPAGYAPMHSHGFVIENNLKSLTELLVTARGNGIGLMIENVPEHFNTASELAQLLDPLPDLALHLDIGHCNLRVPENTTEEILKRFGQRLRHVHLHDNKGGTADLHLPLGTGNIDMAKQLRLLRSTGYDETITLEVFTADKHYLGYSRDVLRQIWDDLDRAPKLKTISGSVPKAVPNPALP
ncbi:MAG TPA: sugar phosphate isomerase/epimerase family protein [Candidatus Saccharimonadales bacterium]|nr:sugar phosphate isomerase/epimerase family protein [Candidatus Saccharimonadales bacterium]